MITLLVGVLALASQPPSPSPPIPAATRPFAANFAHEAVAADHATASEAGAEILAAGGNAVDAAVATSFTLSVVRPYSCGIGGGGFMIVHLVHPPGIPAGGPLTIAINYREQAPAWATPGAFEDLDRRPNADPDASTHGAHAIAVPGTVAGLLHALERYGTMSRDRVLAPAIRAAERGFTVDTHFIASVHEDVLPWFKERPDRQRRFEFLWRRMLREGAVRVGDVITLPEQAEALRLISDHGADGFYRGPVADAMVESVRRDGGRLTHADLASFRVREVEPLRAVFRAREVLTMPPPSSGGIVLAQVMATLDAYDRATPGELSELSPRSPVWIHLLTEASKHAFADRARFLADPEFVPVPMGRLLDPAAMEARAAMLDPTRTLDPARYGLPGEPAAPTRDGGTSHLSVIDRHGNAVACTETINLIFGSFLDASGYGFILNNEMDDFTTRRGAVNVFGLKQSDGNLPAPGKRPLSSMTPVVVLGESKDGRRSVELVAGGSGGPRIISATVQTALGSMLFGLSAGDAVSQPRFHHQWQPDVLQSEASLLAEDIAGPLRALGHNVAAKEPIGSVQVVRRARDGTLEAASDPRKGGSPAGR